MRLGLGTVQFGIDYGVTNEHGQCSPEEVASILALASKAGVEVLDTAADYGASEAEIGQHLGAGSEFKIVTKTPSLKGIDDSASKVAHIHATFRRSLELLGRCNLYGLILHHCDELMSSDGSALFGAVKEIQALGLAEKIGVSVYNSKQIDQLLERFEPELVQVPVSVLDQRLVASGHLQKLKAAGVEIHARSVFLQGMVLLEPDDAPHYLEGVKPMLRSFRQLAARSAMSPLEAALSFVRGTAEIDCVLVGVTSRDELSEILAAWNNTQGRELDCAHLAVADESIVDPSCWPADE